LDSGETQRYVAIVKGDIRPNYYNSEVLQSVLSETFSILVFQEQIMAIFNKLAGFTLAEADTIRKIIGKKLGTDELRKHEQHFIDGCKKLNSLSEKDAKVLFDKMVEFAGYSFNKSHAVEYSLLSYAMMYLKTYYPLEYFTALLSADREDKVKTYIRDAKRFGIDVSLPDINTSGYKFTISGNTIVAPLTSIKGIGGRVAECVIQEREQNGFYKSYDDFLNRIYKRVVNKRVQKILSDVGAFRSVGIMVEDENEYKENCLRLVKIFDELPNINLVKRKIHKDIMLNLYDAIEEKDDTAIIFPTTATSPSILLITTPPESEGKKLDENGRVRMMWHKSTTWLYDIASQFGFKKSDFYVTSATKYAVKTKWKYDPSVYVYAPDTSLETLEESKQYIELELKMVKPSLVICLNTYWAKILLDKKIQMQELAGTIEWSNKYQLPIAFCYSPQYCYYRGEADKMVKMFEEINSLIN